MQNNWLSIGNRGNQLSGSMSPPESSNVTASLLADASEDRRHALHTKNEQQLLICDLCMYILRNNGEMLTILIRHYTAADQQFISQTLGIKLNYSLIQFYGWQLSYSFRNLRFVTICRHWAWGHLRSSQFAVNSSWFNWIRWLVEVSMCSNFKGPAYSNYVNTSIQYKFMTFSSIINKIGYIDLSTIFKIVIFRPQAFIKNRVW